jgi:alkylation response protein AidB-like acyl-CoA dehydrogenase
MIITEAIQLFGGYGYGYVDDYPAERMVRLQDHPDLTRANRLVTCCEALEDVAGGVGEVGVDGEALAVDVDGR